SSPAPPAKYPWAPGSRLSAARRSRSAMLTGSVTPGRLFGSGTEILPPMPKRRKRREGEPVETVDYTDPEGSVLTLRQALSNKTIEKMGEPPRADAASAEDRWARRNELLFERLVVSWEIAGLPLDDQPMLLGRYRMADSATQRWVRETINTHLERHIPELL